MDRKKRGVPVEALPDSSRTDLERKLGHTFVDPNILWEALQAHGNGYERSNPSRNFLFITPLTFL
jgi:hypothetical protein